MRKLLTVADLAERWNTTERQVRDLRYRGEIAGIKIGGLLRFHPTDVDAYETKQSDISGDAA